MNKRIAWIAFIVGAVALLAGAIYFILNLPQPSTARDAEYLVGIGTWAIKDDSGTENVIWHFTEIGKGTLTTNNHQNDYDFLWAMDGNQLTIETDWLYQLDDAFTYHLDQSANTLTLTRDDTSVTFIPYSAE